MTDANRHIWPLNFARAVAAEIVEFCRFLEPTAEEAAMREAATQRVREVILSIWPQASVQIFGSFVTGSVRSAFRASHASIKLHIPIRYHAQRAVLLLVCCLIMSRPSANMTTWSYDPLSSMSLCFPSCRH